jgi:hypothetical protein
MTCPVWNGYSFAPALAARDRYEVLRRWWYWPDYASNAPFVVHHEDGSSTVRMNQMANRLSKKWNPLGAAAVLPGRIRHGPSASAARAGAARPYVNPCLRASACNNPPAAPA